MHSCEILSIGTELLLGQIINTNSQFLSEELAAIGINCYFQTTVGDNRERIKESLRLALSRAEIILCTGGLVPTADDLTTECIAETLHAEMEFDEAVMQRIEAFFRTRGYPMPESNRKQALRPVGAKILPNPRGTAPGIIWEVSGEMLERVGITHPSREHIIMTFPGVPGEMKAMWRETAAPFLVSKFGEQVLWSTDLKHYGIGESTLAGKYAHLLENANPTVAPYAGQGECKLRITARASTVEEAHKLAQPVIDEITTGSRHLLYGTNDDTLESVIGKLLKEQSLSICVAESCTGGLVSKRLTDVAGSSAYIKLNVVTYANEMKQSILGVSTRTLETEGAVSEECAKEMAEGIRTLGDCDLAVFITGVAGPDGGTAEKPVGLVYVGLADGKRTRVRRFTFPEHLTRQEIRLRAASEALNMVRLYLLKAEP